MDPHPICAREHVVQLAGPLNRSFFIQNVARFLSDGLQRGDGLIVIAGEQNSGLILGALERFGLPAGRLMDRGTMKILDARSCLKWFLQDGKPREDLFLASVGAKVEQLRRKSESGEVSAYGEMVGVLWGQGCYSAAMVLEDQWNHLLSTMNSRLFCGYDIDIFGESFHTCDVDALLSSHSHLVPADADGLLEDAISRGIEKVLGKDAGPMREMISADPPAPWASRLRAESLILEIRKLLPNRASEILANARQNYALAGRQELA